MATVHRTELLKSAADLLDLGQIKQAAKVCIYVGKLELEDMFQDISDDSYEQDDYIYPTTFGEVHDLCDANEIGGLCTDVVFDAVERFGVKQGMPEGDALSMFGNMVQDALHKMLKRKQIKPNRYTFI